MLGVKLLTNVKVLRLKTLVSESRLSLDQIHRVSISKFFFKSRSGILVSKVFFKSRSSSRPSGLDSITTNPPHARPCLSEMVLVATLLAPAPSSQQIQGVLNWLTTASSLDLCCVEVANAPHEQN